MNGFAPVLVFGLAAAVAGGQSPGSHWLAFSLDRTGEAVVHYTISVEQETGQGFYRADSPENTGRAATPGAGVQRPIVVQPVTVKKMFAAVPLVKTNRCDSHNKSIAQTGVKTLRYTSDANVSVCTYNYALDERVNDATAVFEALAETMQYGDRLGSKLRFDRLGLDAEMDNLQNALNDGRAIEVHNIAPVLQAIQSDERVMDRVRRKAAHLLQTASGPATQASGENDPSAR